MQTLVVYDIQDDRLRARIANACKDYGLKRIQLSAFLGEINHNRREERMPDPTRSRGRCRDCEFRNWCGDVG